MLGGVAGGLAEYLNVDPVLVRLVFVILFLANASGLLVYVILWLVLPSKSKLNLKSDSLLRENASEIRERAQGISEQFKSRQVQDRTRIVIGGVVIFFGVMVLLRSFGLPNLLDWGFLWPITLVVIGVMILFKK